MTGNRSLMKIIAILFSSILFSQTLLGFHVTTQTSTKTLGINETLSFTLTVHSAPGNASLDNTFLRDFHIVRQQNTNKHQIKNGQSSSLASIIFTLRPKKVGKATIHSTTVKSNGQEVKTPAIAITVTNATTPPPAPNQTNTSQTNTQQQPKRPSDLFIRAELSKDSLYVGEELHYVIYLYRRVSLMTDINYELPNFGNTSSQALERDPNTYKQVFEGRRYYVQEIDRRALFPLEAGLLEIPAAKAETQTSFFHGARQLNSNPVSATVLALPEEKPENYGGSVGDFSLETSLDSNVFIQNKPIALRLSISGKGNLQHITGFNYDDSPQFRIYQSSINDQITAKDNIKGTRHFEYIIVPKESGEQQLPAFWIHSFSPSSKSFIELRKNSHPITVLESDQINQSFSPTNTDVQQLREDLRYIHTKKLSAESTPFYNSLVALIIGLANTLFILWFLSRILFKQQLDTLLEHSFSQKADKIALKELKGLDKQGSLTETSQQLQRILYTYLSQILGKEAKGLPHHELETALLKSGLSETQVHITKSLLDRCAYLSYTPDGSSSETLQALIQESTQLITAIKGGST